MDALASLIKKPVDVSLAAYRGAVLAGRDTYFTGEACRRGHVAERYVGNRTCVQCQRERHNRFKEQGSRGRYDGEMFGFKEPYPWSDDGSKRREPVIDLATNRVVRRVGWVRCLSPVETTHRFFSCDVVKVRTCSDCRNRISINQSKLGCEN